MEVLMDRCSRRLVSFSGQIRVIIASVQSGGICHEAAYEHGRAMILI
jgi:hypothetical protein